MIHCQNIFLEQAYYLRGYDMDEFYKDTVTIYNRHENKAEMTEMWYPTVLHNVRLLVTKGANMVKTGANTADSARLHIYMERVLEKAYKEPKEWLEAPDKLVVFTFKEGDFFVKGDTSVEEVIREDFAEYMKQKYDNCFCITTVDTYTLIPHMEVGGK